MRQATQICVYLIVALFVVSLASDHDVPRARAERSSVVLEAPPSMITSGTAHVHTGRFTTFDEAPVWREWGQLLAKARMSGWEGRVSGELSGLRSKSQQTHLYECFLRGECPPAFHPDGPSRHLKSNAREWGWWSQAVDVKRAKELIETAWKCCRVRLHAPYPDEPWHVEAVHPFHIAE